MHAGLLACPLRGLECVVANRSGWLDSLQIISSHGLFLLAVLLIVSPDS